MSWQTFTKNNGLGISVVKLSQLEENTRIDAEYYLPEYLIPYRTGLACKPIGSILSKCQYGISQEMNEEGLGVEIYRMNELEDGLCKDHDLKFVDIDEKTRKLYYLKPNDILFNRVNSIEFVGRTAIYKHEERNRVFASYLIRVNTDEKVVLPDYLNIFLNCKYGKKELKRKARWAVNQANINAEELKRIALPIAPFSIQQKIEAMVDKSHSLTGSSRNKYTEAEQLLLKEINLDGYKKTDKNVSVRNVKDCVVADRFDAEYWQPKYDKIEKNVSSISQKELNEIVSVKKGFEPGSEAYCDEGKLFVRVSDFSIYGIDEGEKRISETLYEKLKENYKPCKEEILFTKDGTIGTSFALHEDIDVIVSGAFLRLKPKIKINNDYLALVLNSSYCKSQIERMSGGAIIAHLKPDSAMKIKIPILSDEKQTELAKKVSTALRLRKEAKLLLENAKRAVEIFIEQNEDIALTYLEKSLVN